jgi:hypothetical protein
MNVFLIRNGHRISYEPDYFWFLVHTMQLLRSDLILDSRTNQFLQADRFADFEPYLPPKSPAEILEDVISAAVGIGVVVVIGATAAELIASVLGPTKQSKARKRRQPNYEPLESWKKQLVRVRDDEICGYCGVHDPAGHVDHKTSRANGGSNLLRNLVWSCTSCNCSKGRMNTPAFRRLSWN